MGKWVLDLALSLLYSGGRALARAVARPDRASDYPLGDPRGTKPTFTTVTVWASGPEDRVIVFAVGGRLSGRIVLCCQDARKIPKPLAAANS